MKKKIIICSPRPQMLTSTISRPCPTVIMHSQFQCDRYDEDTWTAIAEFLDGKSLIKLALANRRLYNLVMEESIWKFACLRDLEVPAPPEPPQFSWKDIYAAAFNGSHSYSTRQVEKHIDWMRIGALYFDSGEVLVTEKLWEVKGSFSIEGKEQTRVPVGACALTNVKTGIWIADLQLVRCPVCNLKTCEGTMQTLDIRHFELFLHREYIEESWEFVEVSSHALHNNCSAATAGIFVAMNLKSPSILGLHVSYHVPKARDNGLVLAISVSHQLI